MAGKVTGRAAFEEFRRWLVVGVRVPPPAARPVAVVAVAAEAATTVALVIPGTVPAGFGAATLLLGVFTVAVAGMWRRRVGVPCRCFGAGRHPPGPTHLARNVTLLLVAVLGGLLALAGNTAAGGLAAVAGAAVALLLIDLEEIVAVLRPRRRAAEREART